jgi:hypothetical protein
MTPLLVQLSAGFNYSISSQYLRQRAPLTEARLQSLPMCRDREH